MPFSGNRILVFDPQASGVSGDMMVGALLDIGADITRVVEAMHTPKHFLADCYELEITVGDIVVRDIRAKRVDVRVKEDTSSRSAQDLISALSACLEGIRISDEANRYALHSLNKLVSAEASIHADNMDDIHLHETASADTLADIIGTATALDDLSLFTETTVYSTPVALGGGLVNFSHGISSSPAPATLEILRSREFPCRGGPVAAELATPTGVSLLTSLVHEPAEFYPPMKPLSVGYGAGARDFAEMPNVLRVTYGDPVYAGLTRDDVYVIDTNLDDISGEKIGFTIDRLLKEGARDAV
ncbi:MAG: LarC family nickel insertion protein, partial [Dehalococcoidia bacterium]